MVYERSLKTFKLLQKISHYLYPHRGFEQPFGCFDTTSLTIMDRQLFLILFLQVHNLLSVMLGSMLFLRTVFRFFLVLYAERFVKKGNLCLNLLQQLYWLAWVVFVVNGLVPFVPLLSGTYPWNTYRGQLCLGALADGENDKSTEFTQHLFFAFKMLTLAFYGVKYFQRVNKYVHGHCPGRKMSSIGKYPRNIIGLQETLFIILILHCFAFAILIFRLTAKNLDKSNAFLVNLICESCLHSIYFSVFIFARSKDMPTRKQAARCVKFNTSKVKTLQPRRPHDMYFPSKQCPIQVDLDISKTCMFELKEPAGLKLSNQNSSQSNSKLCLKDTNENSGISKIHPRVTTVYHSSSKAKQNTRLREDGFKSVQPKRRTDSMNLLQMPPIASENHLPIDLKLQKDPEAIINFPSESFRIHVHSIEDSDQIEPVQLGVHRFSYFTTAKN